MPTAQKSPIDVLFERDESAWLEAMSDLIRQGRLEELDYPNLAEYLADMARRDRREVESRLSLLLAHVLKWEHQADQRSGSWRATIVVQRQELSRLLGRGILFNHAKAVLPQTYADALEQVVAETGLSAETFPETCPYTLEQLLSSDLLSEE